MYIVHVRGLALGLGEQYGRLLEYKTSTVTESLESGRCLTKALVLPGMSVLQMRHFLHIHVQVQCSKCPILEFIVI